MEGLENGVSSSNALHNTEGDLIASVIRPVEFWNGLVTSPNRIFQSASVVLQTSLEVDGAMRRLRMEHLREQWLRIHHDIPVHTIPGSAI